MTSIYVKDQTVVKFLISSFRNNDNGIRASLKEESIYRQMFALKPENINSFQLKLIRQPYLNLINLYENINIWKIKNRFFNNEAGNDGDMECTLCLYRNEHPDPVHIILPQNSDINLFIYGLDEEAAKKKMEEIYENVCKAIPWEVTCIRSKHCVTIISQYLAYSTNILRGSLQEFGFDVDFYSVGRSPMRLAKYTEGGFEFCNTSQKLIH
ncbi:hypothetical protein RhiirA4_482598 [Rhizophagus irregularis]|uniref:Uncharacterized protein n=1 Tax=Rhizophagus irregularis TaxID=588596 RepID=A0A2I1HLE5_9GLOM|nr:hypothetical protein RhiirA4_482598 [Rhizophagus irregularis]